MSNMATYLHNETTKQLSLRSIAKEFYCPNYPQEFKSVQLIL